MSAEALSSRCGGEPGRKAILTKGGPVCDSEAVRETGAGSLGAAGWATLGGNRFRGSGYGSGRFITHTGWHPTRRCSGDPFQFPKDHSKVVKQTVEGLKRSWYSIPRR